MGCDDDNGAESCNSDEDPLHTVNLDAYYIDKYEVTNARYKACVDAGGCTAPSNTSSSTRLTYYGNTTYNNYPVVWISWQQANTFCIWAGKRLPTEAEWEKAARGDSDTRKYPWGNAAPTASLLKYNSSGGDTALVGSHTGGTSPYGVMDMAGNVWEWTHDWYHDNYYEMSPGNDPQGPSTGTLRVSRGGSWRSNASEVRNAYRYPVVPGTPSNSIGFRCVRSPSASPTATLTPTPTLTHMPVPTATPTSTPAVFGLSLIPERTLTGIRSDTHFALTGMGDVNGDGYDDLIVGADRYDSGQTNEGAVYVFYGSADGLNTVHDWMVESNQNSVHFGYNTTGDFNGDGYDDIAAGAYSYDSLYTDEGAVFVYYGSPTGPSLTPGWQSTGNQAGAYFGVWVASAGDVNGDGYDDLLVVASGYDNGQTDEGRAFLFYGSATGLSAQSGWSMESDQNSGGLTRAKGAGDVNGDGYDDVIVGAENYDANFTNEGRVWLFYGSPTGLSTTAGWVIDGKQAGARFGSSVASAGDVNGDGYDDLLIGAYY